MSINIEFFFFIIPKLRMCKEGRGFKIGFFSFLSYIGSTTMGSKLKVLIIIRIKVKVTAIWNWNSNWDWYFE